LSIRAHLLLSTFQDIFMKICQPMLFEISHFLLLIENWKLSVMGDRVRAEFVLIDIR
jgi:hypothetical protein